MLYTKSEGPSDSIIDDRVGFGAEDLTYHSNRVRRLDFKRIISAKDNPIASEHPLQAVDEFCLVIMGVPLIGGESACFLRGIQPNLA